MVPDAALVTIRLVVFGKILIDFCTGDQNGRLHLFGTAVTIISLFLFS